ncbi:hypothetical protein ACC676_08210 [Rhizobium ruizarguesonis]
MERSESVGFGFDQRNNRWMWLTSSSKSGIERLQYWMASTSSEIPNIGGTEKHSVGSGNFILIGKGGRQSRTRALGYKMSNLSP